MEKKNYFLQNYEYVGGDNPLNIKKAVLDCISSYGLFVHMRDERREKMYDIENVSYETNPMGIPYHEAEIKNYKRKIVNTQHRIDLIESNTEAEYAKYCSSMSDALSPAIRSDIQIKINEKKKEELKRKMKKLIEFVNTQGLKFPGDFKRIIISNVVEWIDSLADDINNIDIAIEKALAKKEESVEEKTAAILDMESWRKNEIAILQNIIDVCNRRIKEEENAIESLKERDKIIKQIYEVLDTVDEDIY